MGRGSAGGIGQGRTGLGTLPEGIGDPIGLCSRGWGFSPAGGSTWSGRKGGQHPRASHAFKRHQPELLAWKTRVRMGCPFLQRGRQPPLQSGRLADNHWQPGKGFPQVAAGVRLGPQGDGLSPVFQLKPAYPLGKVLPVEELLKHPEHQIGPSGKEKQQGQGQVEIDGVAHQSHVLGAHPLDQEQGRTPPAPERTAKNTGRFSESPAGTRDKKLPLSPGLRRHLPKAGNPTGQRVQAGQGAQSTHKSPQDHPPRASPQLQHLLRAPQQEKVHIQVDDHQHIGINGHRHPPVSPLL